MRCLENNMLDRNYKE